MLSQIFPMSNLDIHVPIWGGYIFGHVGRPPCFFTAPAFFLVFEVLDFCCFFIVFPLFLCWNICWNVGCVVFVVLIVDVCVVILVHHQKWCPIPINIGVRKNDEKYLTKRWWLYYCLWGEWFVCLLLKQWRACTDEQWTDEREGGGHTSTRTWGFIWQWRSIFAIMLKGEVMPHPYKYSVAGQKYTLWEVTMYILVFQEPLFNFIDAVRKAKWCDAPSL